MLNLPEKIFGLKVFYLFFQKIIEYISFYVNITNLKRKLDTQEHFLWCRSEVN